MKLKNTPWKYEAHADGTCEIYATDKRRETGLRWIGAAIDEPTALAIAALPDTLAELERVKKERDELRAFVNDFYEVDYPSFEEWLIQEDKAQQLLTPKE